MPDPDHGAAPPDPASGRRNRKLRAVSLRDAATPLADPNRPLPAAPEAEEALLGCALLSPRTVLAEVVGKAGETEDLFSIPANATIFRTLVELDEKQQPIDLVTVTAAMKDRGTLDQIGGPAALARLLQLLPTAANAGFYLELVRQKQLLRRVILTCTDCASRAYDPQESVDSLLDTVEQSIFAISQSRESAEIRPLKHHIVTAIDNFEKALRNQGQIGGLPTGFADLDHMTGGLRPAEMIIIAARPSMGKTALAMNIAEHAALAAKATVAIFSLEMSTDQLVQRLLCSLARVNLSKVRDGYLSSRDIENISEAARKLNECGIYIDDTPGLSILELKARARRLKSQYDIGLIVIDYLQLLRSPSRRAQDNRQLEIAEISSGLKGLAKELKLPIIVLAQLNREPEKREGGKPRLSDLRESGSIEQDADLVALLVRPDYYKDDEDAENRAGEADLIIAKQRNGPTGEVPLTFLKEFTRFETRARSKQDPA